MNFRDIIYCSLKALSLADDADQDIWSLMSDSSNRLKLLGFSLTSNTTSPAIMSLDLRHISAVGSGGSAQTEVRADSGSGETIVGSVRSLDTTPGTADGEIMAWQWEQVGPVGHIWTPEMAPTIHASHGIALHNNTGSLTPTLSGWLCWGIL